MTRYDIRATEARRLQRIERANAVGELLAGALIIIAPLFILFIGVM